VVKRLKAVSREKRGKMTLSGHLRELRNRILVCVLALLVCCAVFLYYAKWFVKRLTDMGKAYGYVYVYLSPQELLIEYFQVAIIASVCVCLPLLLYQLWAFARPGLSKRENRTVVLCIFFGLFCFAGGLYFAYRIILPFMLSFLIGINSMGSGISASISVQNYINFLLTVFIIFGCIFEMPMVSVVLTGFGILKPQMMRRARKVVVVIIFFIAAVITPPDVFSQAMVAAPMVALYELSIFLCALLTRGIRKKAQVEEEAQDAQGANESSCEDGEVRQSAEAKS
jgi:sec-independent protein translocase protein TatC